MAPSAELIHELVDCVAHGGSFLPAVGPTAGGQIPWIQTKRLLALGWLRRTAPPSSAPAPWTRAIGSTGDLEVRFAQSADAVNAILPDTPSSSTVDLDVAVATGATITLHGNKVG